MKLTVRTKFRPSAYLASALCLVSTFFVASCSAGDDGVSTDAPTQPDAVGPIAQIDAFIQQAGIDKSQPNWRTRLAMPPMLTFDKSAEVTWNLKTSHGRLSFRLLPMVAPQHVSSTIYLTRLGFYDELTFHRIIPGFMAQGGDPLGNGRGGPGYDYAGEFDGSISHDKPGILSMANAGPGTDGSQFFVTFGPTLHLDGRHTIFGELVVGEQTLTAYQEVGSQSGGTREPVTIREATIEIR